MERGRSRFPGGCGTCRTNKASQACKLRVQNTPQPYLWRAGAADRKAENTASAPAQQDWCVDTTVVVATPPNTANASFAIAHFRAMASSGNLKIADAETLRCSRAVLAIVKDTTAVTTQPASRSEVVTRTAWPEWTGGASRRRGKGLASTALHLQGASALRGATSAYPYSYLSCSRFC